MNREQLIALALPHSVRVDPHDGHHVSIFLTPKLLPDHEDATLAEFPTFMSWGRTLAGPTGIEVELVTQDAVIPVQVIQKATAEDWAALFPPETPVAAGPTSPAAVPDWSGKVWASYPVAETVGYAKTLLLATILADPVTPVTPQQHPLAGPILDHFRRRGGIEGEYGDRPKPPENILPQVPRGAFQTEGRTTFEPRDRSTLFRIQKAREDATDRWNADLDAREKRTRLRSLRPQDLVIREDLVTEALDTERAQRASRSALATLRKTASADESVAAAMSDLHECRRFYEEPDRDPASSRIVPQQEPQPLPSPLPEFHRRVAAAGDHPELLRLLGLTLDVVVADAAGLKALRRAQWLYVRMRVQDAPGDLVRSPRVHVRALPDETFVVTPLPERAEEWAQGRLALGAPELFSVVDIDPDGSALKTERFVASLPRMLRVQANGDAVDAAAPALRSTGFVVTRTSQLAAATAQFDRQHDFQTELEQAPDERRAPFAGVNDVMRGLRIEVFDSVAQRWSSLHTRVMTVVLGSGDGTRSHQWTADGFIQGTAAHETPGASTPTVKIHEAVFGWDGWSLSAPRPGDRLRGEVIRNHDDTGWTIRESLEPADAAIDGQTPPHPFAFASTVAKGTLPRLRYGRRYAFRAWIVDLAGNVRPHSLTLEHAGGTDVEDLLDARGMGRLLAAQQPRADAGRAGALLRTAALAQRTPGRGAPGDVPDRGTIRSLLVDAYGAPTPDVIVALDTLADATVARATPVGGVDLAAAVREAAGRLDPTPAARPLRAEHLADLTAFIATQIDTAPTPTLIRRALEGATPLRTFFRWDPVPSPAVVAQSEYTEGESLRVLVLRSGVDQPVAGAAPVITAPKQYAAQAETVVRSCDADAADGAPFYRERAVRHLAAPQTSQLQAELHGVFDASLDGDAADATAAELRATRDRQLAWALRESGTFFDTKRAPLTDRNATWLEQKGVRLVTPPAAGARAVADAAGHVPAPASTPVPGDESAPVVPHGEAPPAGAYVVHDTDRIELPYLPDPLATGIALRFLDAGAGLRAAPPRAVHLTSAPYEGSWPDIRPFGLRVASGPVLDAAVTGRDIDLTLPPGDTQRFVLSSSLDDDGLAKLGVWDALDPAFTDDESVRSGARDGLLWGLTPGELVTVVHAVPRPVVVPELGRMLPHRAHGSSEFALLGLAYVHGPSTEQVSAEMRWTDVSDAGERGAVRRVTTDIGFTTRVQPEETSITLLNIDLSPFGLPSHVSTHAFADTKHRMVEYVLRATTRFREYFHPALIAPPERPSATPPASVDAVWPVDDGKSLLSTTTVVDVPSSAPPPPPVIDSVIPLFRWDDAEEPEQPFARRRTRRSGLRVYLERGWFASGEGELLGVLLGTMRQQVTPDPGATDDRPFVSQWGSDPAWDGAMVSLRRLTPLQLQTFAQIVDPDHPAEAGRPVRIEDSMPVRPAADEAAAVAAPTNVGVVGYEPHFNADRQLWYVDIAFEGAATHWPFVRLAVARFQPSSLPGCHLSTPVQADFVQLPPERVLTVGRPDANRVSVAVRGEYGHRDLDRRNNPHPDSQDLAVRDAGVIRSNRVAASLQQRNPLIGGDLGWTTVSSVDLTIGGHGTRDTEVLWLGALDLPEALPLRRPLARDLDSHANAVAETEDVDITAALPYADAGLVDDPPSEWRVRVEEWQLIPGDPPAGQPDDAGARHNVWERRLVYVDEVYL